MLSKEAFIENINFIKAQHEKEDKFCSVLEEMSPQCYIDAFIYSEYENHLVQLLKVAMDVQEEDDTIEYFMYDLNFGDDYSTGSLTAADGTDVDLSSTDKLYDYLVGKKDD